MDTNIVTRRQKRTLNNITANESNIFIYLVMYIYFTEYYHLIPDLLDSMIRLINAYEFDRVITKLDIIFKVFQHIELDVFKQRSWDVYRKVQDVLSNIYKLVFDKLKGKDIDHKNAKQIHRFIKFYPEKQYHTRCIGYFTMLFDWPKDPKTNKN